MGRQMFALWVRLINTSAKVRLVYSFQDASVIPFQLSAHLSSTLYGMAEKVSGAPLPLIRL